MAWSALKFDWNLSQFCKSWSHIDDENILGQLKLFLVGTDLENFKIQNSSGNTHTDKLFVFGVSSEVTGKFTIGSKAPVAIVTLVSL